jgi:hypothetical protein
LKIIPDPTHKPPLRYVVKDEDDNIQFITSLRDKEPEKSAVLWAMKRGGWLKGVVEGGSVIDESFSPMASFTVIAPGKPLYVVPDPTHNPPKRLMVEDEEGNVLFLTDIGEEEPEQAATYMAMKLGGWLRGMILKQNKL